jgi:hypothetical protein
MSILMPLYIKAKLSLYQALEDHKVVTFCNNIKDLPNNGSNLFTAVA